MDLVTDDQQIRLAALERVATADPVETSPLPGQLVAAVAPILRVATSVGLLLVTVLGVLWLLV